jgi:ABC-type transporter Mla subunit MlaD
MVEVEGTPPAGAVLCSQGCHVLLPGARFDPHTGEPVEVPEPEPAEAPTEPIPFTPIPSSRALVPYIEPGIDFEKLEREIHEAVRSSADVQETMRDLVGAIGEYGEHLRSHTAVMQNLAEVSGELKETTSEMRTFLATLTTLLTQLVQQSQAPPEG